MNYGIERQTETQRVWMSWVFRRFHGVLGSSLTRHWPKPVLRNYLPHRTEIWTEENDTETTWWLKCLLPWLPKDSYFRENKFTVTSTYILSTEFSCIPNLPTVRKIPLSWFDLKQRNPTKGGLITFTSNGRIFIPYPRLMTISLRPPFPKPLDLQTLFPCYLGGYFFLR